MNEKTDQPLVSCLSNKRITRVLALVLALSICGLFVSASTDSTGTGCAHGRYKAHIHGNTMLVSHSHGAHAAEICATCTAVCGECGYPVYLPDGCGAVVASQEAGKYVTLPCGCMYCEYCHYTDDRYCSGNHH